MVDMVGEKSRCFIHSVRAAWSIICSFLINVYLPSGAKQVIKHSQLTTHRERRFCAVDHSQPLPGVLGVPGVDFAEGTSGIPLIPGTILGCGNAVNSLLFLGFAA